MRKTVFVLAGLLSVVTPPVHAGWDKGNAGDTYVAEFVLTARDVVQRLELVSSGGAPVADTVALRGALANAKVESLDHVFLNGVEKDAVNYPDQHLIQVNRTRWDVLRRSTATRERLQLALHEFLYLTGVDDNNFAHSGPMIDLLNIENYSPNIWWDPVNPINTVVPRLSFAPEHCSFEFGTFHVKQASETVVLESKGPCGDAYRRLQIVKTTGVIPASSGVRGKFHSYDLTVFDQNQQVRGAMSFEPEWGECLVPESGGCRSSGKMTIGGVEIVFWFLRD